MKKMKKTSHRKNEKCLKIIGRWKETLNKIRSLWDVHERRSENEKKKKNGKKNKIRRNTSPKNFHLFTKGKK